MKKYSQIVNVIYEAATVKRMQRTGWQILGDNEEELGGHSFMTAVIAYFLGKQLHADIEKVMTMAIFHDFHEARTGDLDKIATFYVQRDQGKANKDIFDDVDPELLSTLNEYEDKKSLEARIVYEANIIALLVELKQLVEKGNSHAQEWITANIKRLHISEAIKLAEVLIKTGSQDWWKDIRMSLHKKFAK